MDGDDVGIQDQVDQWSNSRNPGTQWGENEYEQSIWAEAEDKCKKRMNCVWKVGSCLHY